MFTYRDYLCITRTHIAFTAITFRVNILAPISEDPQLNESHKKINYKYLVKTIGLLSTFF
jgi:hypothetical protein